MQRTVTSRPGSAASPSIQAAFAAVDNRGPGFDTLRLVAASAVVLHHALEIAIDIIRDDWLFAFTAGYTHLGLFAVSLFFALSGFLVAPGLVKNGDVVEFVSRRFMRIMPLLACVVVVTAFVVGPLLSTLSPGEYFASPATYLYLKNITTSLSLALPGVTNHAGDPILNSPIWTLRFEWICYLLLAGASLFAVLRHRFLFLLVWIAAQAVLIVHYGPVSASEVRPTVFVLCYLFAYFGAGTLIFLYGDVIRISGLRMALAVAALVLAWRFELSYLFAPALTAYLVVGIGLVRLPWSRFLEKADLSYGVYLTHSVIMAILMHAFAFENWIVLFVASLSLSLLAALATWTFIERPALQRKSLPAALVRPVLHRIPILSHLVRAR